MVEREVAVVRLHAIALLADDPTRLAAFWGALLTWARRGDPSGADPVLVPTAGPGFPLRFVPASEPKSGRNRAHFDLTSTSADDQRVRVARALELGGRHADVGQGAEVEHVVLADPEGNEFCVIEPGNAFLAGCGVIGALSCDGSEAVGRFWSSALEWPLVWDQDQETAIQSPAGGTKITWGGPPPMPRFGPERFHLELAVESDEDPRSATDRLLALGASTAPPGHDASATAMLDPDGNPFCLLPSD